MKLDEEDDEIIARAAGLGNAAAAAMLGGMAMSTTGSNTANADVAKLVR